MSKAFPGVLVKLRFGIQNLSDEKRKELTLKLEEILKEHEYELPGIGVKIDCGRHKTVASFK